MAARDGWKEFLAGCLVGAVVGSAAALLLTPRTGRDNREALARKTRRLAVKAYSACLDPHSWNEWVAAEEAENLINNIEGIRSAGL